MNKLLNKCLPLLVCTAITFTVAPIIIAQQIKAYTVIKNYYAEANK